MMEINHHYAKTAIKFVSLQDVQTVYLKRHYQRKRTLIITFAVLISAAVLTDALSVLMG